MQARNDKIDRLGELKTLKRDWQQFERQFGKELDLAASREAPKTGTFKVPDTGEEFVFTKSQSKYQRKAMLAEFQVAFKASAGHKAYQHASAETRNIESERAELKSELSRSTKELRLAVDKQFDQKEVQAERRSEKAMEVKHDALDAEKDRVEEGHDKLVVLYQGQVDEVVRDLSELRNRRDSFKGVKIPAKEREVERLKDQMDRELAALKKQYKAMSKSEKSAVPRETFMRPLQTKHARIIREARHELSLMKQEVDNYKENRNLLNTELKKGQKESEESS